MKITLGKKLGLGFACVLALMIVSAVLAYVRARVVQQNEDHTLLVRVPASMPLRTCRET